MYSCSLVKDIKHYTLCCGVKAGELTSQLFQFHHVIPLSEDPLKDEQNHFFPNKGYWRSKNCALMCYGGKAIACSACMDYMASVEKTTSSSSSSKTLFKLG